MDDLQLKRLQWMANAKFGDIPPDELGMGPNNWAKPVAGAAKAALDKIAQLEEGWGRMGFPTWEPIATAPMPEYKPDGYNAPFRCLGQMEPNGGNPPWVCEIEGYWVPPNSRIKIPLLRWRSNLGQVFPKYWMPLPAAKKEQARG